MRRHSSEKSKVFRKKRWEREDVLALVLSLFPHENTETLLSLLDTYGTEPYEQEQARVQVAILQLSAGDLQKVREYIKAAKVDYRDILLWSQIPPSPPC